MNSSFLKIVVITAGLAMASAVLAATAPPPATTVNGVAIPRALVDAIVNSQVQQGTPDSAELRAAITDRLVEMEILTQEADKKKLGKSPEVKAQLEIQRLQTLANAFLQDYAKNHPVSDEAAKTEYDRLRAKAGDKDYKASHILLDSEDEAKGIIARLKLGEKFEDLAKASKDNGSKDKGGALDWNSPDGYVKPFSDAMVKLEKGQYTDAPVQSQFGWHVIRLDDVRPAQYPPFDEVKDQLKQSIQQEALKKMVQTMRDKAKIEKH